jgi:hypothetical protein
MENKIFPVISYDPKKSNLKLYWSIIRPTAKYGCETWVLKETIKNELIVLERKALRRIFGPTKERDGTWRIQTIHESYALTL